jgi:deazaflavin-dependent oxidoreductase (nitroreductase family)
MSPSKMSPSKEMGAPPPHWLIRSFGVVNLAFLRLTGGRLGLSRPRPDRWGTMCLTTTGRRTGRERSAILGYFEDGPNLVALAVNAWAGAEPAWWLNLQARPDTKVELKDGFRPVRARAAEGEERARLWARWRGLGKRSGEALMADVDGYAGRLSREVAVVVLEPRPDSGPDAIAQGGVDEMNPSTGPGGMHVEESGAPGSPAIVFIHGVGQNGREWREHMARLGGFHCLAPDLPGHGRSNHLPLPSNERIADLLAELIETRVPAGRAHVVGISWGALLVQVLMARHPDRVDRAVADGLPLVWPRGARPLMLWLITLVAPFLHTRPVLALYGDIVDAADLRVASRFAFWKVWAVSLAHPSAATEAGCPTLLVAGEKESFMRPADAALARLMPHAEAWYAPGLGHCWQRKEPELHIRMVEAWFTGQELPSELRPEPAPSAAAVERLRRTVPATA